MSVPKDPCSQALRVQVLNNHILTQNPYYNYYYPNPKYLIIGYMDSLGNMINTYFGPRVHKLSGSFPYLGYKNIDPKIL